MVEVPPVKKRKEPPTAAVVKPGSKVKKHKSPDTVSAADLAQDEPLPGPLATVTATAVASPNLIIFDDEDIPMDSGSSTPVLSDTVSLADQMVQSIL